MSHHTSRLGILLIVTASAAAVFNSCSDDSGNAVGAGGLVILSPSGAAVNVNADHLTIEIDGSGLTTVSAELGGTSLDGIRSGDRFYVFGVSLAPGSNPITVSGRRTDGTVLTSVINVTSPARPTGTLDLDISPTEAEGTPAILNFVVDASGFGNLQEFLVDREGDGVIDMTLPVSPGFAVTYTDLVAGKPAVTVRTTDNLLLTSESDHAPRIGVLPPTTVNAALNFGTIGSDVTDLAVDPLNRDLYVLSSAGSIRRFTSGGILIATHTYPGAANPQGLDLDESRNLLIADTGNHRVVRLLAPGYAPDPIINGTGFFGANGVSDGLFNSPSDVFVEGSGNDQKIFVADTGNNRIQRFNRAGVFEAAYDGTSGGAAFSSPRSLARLSGGGMLVSDSGNSLVRLVSSDGSTVLSMGGPGTTPGTLSAPRHVFQDLLTNDIFVADTGNNRVQSFHSDGTPSRAFSMIGTTPLVAVVIPGSPRRMLVASTLDNQIRTFDIIEDPPGFTPIDVTLAFFSALSAGDFASARNHVVPERRARFDALFASEADRLQAMQNAASTTGLTVTYTTPTASIVEGSRQAGATTQSVDLSLVRSVASGRWTLADF